MYANTPEVTLIFNEVANLVYIVIYILQYDYELSVNRVKSESNVRVTV
jgi:hypothetical protein